MLDSNEKDRPIHQKENDKENLCRPPDPVTLQTAEITIEDIRRIVAKLKEDETEE